MRRKLGLLALAGLLAAGAAQAQTPMQLLQQQQTGALLNARPSVPFGPSQGTVQTLPNLVGPDRVLSRTGTETQSEGGPVAVGPLGDGSRAAGATAVFGAALFTREATA